jgi:ATP adenylyltransferase/5',5'''-P-1,P-4-tetraphosphate phosphorylase II
MIIIPRRAERSLGNSFNSLGLMGGLIIKHSKKDLKKRLMEKGFTSIMDDICFPKDQHLM